MNTMKRFLVYLFSMTPLYSLLLLLFLSMSGCTKSVLDGEGSGDGDVMVRFEMDMPSDMRGQIDTRAAGDDENTVSTIHLLAFVEDAPGVYRFDGNTITGTMYTPGAPASFSAKLKTHVKPQRFMILVNAGGVVGNINYNDDIATATSKLVYHRVPEWETGAANFEPLPLYGLSPAVTVTSSTNTVGPFDLVGMHARFDVKVKAGEPSFVLEDVQIFNRKNRGYLYYDPATNWDSSLECVYTANVPGTAPANNEYLPTAIFAVPTTGVNTGKSVGQLYTFEATAQANRLDATAIVVGGYYNGTGSKTYYRIDVPSTVKGGQILRNHLYDIEIQKANGPGAGSAEDAFKGETKIQATITPWNLANQKIVLDGGQYEFTVSTDKIVFPFVQYGGVDEFINVTTDHPNPIAVNVEYLGSEQNWITVDETAITGGKRLKFTAAGYYGSFQPRIAKLKLSAGNFTYVVIAAQQPQEYPLKYYAGTFHRASEVGERVIRLRDAAIGDWTATVIAGADFIKLDTEGGDRTLPLGGDPEDPSNHVTGNATEVTGFVDSANPDIYFRVGMKSQLSSVKPDMTTTPRYGVISVTYGYNSTEYRIYVRQGEADDYLMRPENPGPNGDTWGSPIARPYAGKISAFNVATTAVNIINPNLADYPSCVGGYYVYNSGQCPTGYHDFEKDWLGGTVVVATSEVAQSLIYNVNRNGGNNNHIMNTENMVSGYYADGAFDRGEIVAAPQGSSGSLTGMPNSHVISPVIGGFGYFWGQLFYNPIDNNSIFLPASGDIDSWSYLSNAGQRARYNGYVSSNSGPEQNAPYTETIMVQKIYGNRIPFRCIKD